MNRKKIIDHYKSGGMIIVTDDYDRENEGDLMVSSQCCSVEHISFMAKYGRGLICMPIEKATAERLELPYMWEDNSSQYSTAFTISVDAKEDTTTGISAFDRMKTIETILNENTKPEELLRPGHLFPLIAHEGGLKARRGHTEAAVDLGRFVGHKASGIICEIMGDDGSMLRGKDLLDFSNEHGLPLISIEDLIDYMNEETQESTSLPTKFGDFHLYHFDSGISEQMPHIVLLHKEADMTQIMTTRIHSECLTGDLFGSLRCDCGEQLKESLRIIDREKGLLIYLRQEGRGIGLVKKMEAYRLQDTGLDTVDANLELGFSPDEREYKIVGEILKHFEIDTINLLTNNPEKITGIEREGIEIHKRIPLIQGINKTNSHYMKTKIERMDHIIEMKEVI